MQIISPTEDHPGMMKRTILVLCWWAWSVASCSAVREVQALPELVRWEAERLLRDGRFNALSIAVLHKGLKSVAHFGELDPGGGEPPDGETLYEVASVTKTLTGYLVARAVEEGSLSLEDSVPDLLGPRFANLAFEGSPVLVRHLLTHTSGLPLHPPVVEALYVEGSVENYTRARDYLSTLTQDEFLGMVAAVRLERPPGQQYEYSNIAPNLLAYLLERQLSAPFGELLERELQGPLGMHRTWINLDDEQRARLAPGYDGSGVRMPQYDRPIALWGADGRAKMTAGDLLSWIQWQVQTDAPVVKATQEPLFYDTDGIWIGHFWEIIKTGHGPQVEHHGGLYGSQCWVILQPERGAGVAILSNASFPGANELLKSAAQGILDGLE